jgi:hypothetical protein
MLFPMEKAVRLLEVFDFRILRRRNRARRTDRLSDLAPSARVRFATSSHSVTVHYAKDPHQMGCFAVDRSSAAVDKETVENRGLAREIVGESAGAFKLKRPVLNDRYWK